MTNIECALRWFADHQARLEFTDDLFGRHDDFAAESPPAAGLRVSVRLGGVPHGEKLTCIVPTGNGRPVGQAIMRAYAETSRKYEDGPPCHST